MNSFFKEIVDIYTKSDELKKIATLWGLEEDPYVQERIFQLKCQEFSELIDQDVMISIWNAISPWNAMIYSHE